MEDLRQHPKYEALPEVVKELNCIEDVRNFPQDSWQWGALHEGRCTTSQAVAALGFLEPKAAKILKIPKSWRSRNRSLRAYQRLSLRPYAQTLPEMKERLLLEDDDSEKTETTTKTKNKQNGNKKSSVWNDPPQRYSSNKSTNTTSSSSFYPFAARHTVPITQQELKHRKIGIDKMLQTTNITNSQIPMMWGSIQESTSLLTALNYFHNRSTEEVILKEVGMCGASITIPAINETTTNDVDNNVLIGASPDGLLYYPSSGKIEVLEVKNHCPFYYDYDKENFKVRSFKFDIAGKNNWRIPPQYLPQLMLEIYCCGQNCSSALMLRQTALSGALLLRVQRDDEWINEMLHWIQRFYADYVRKQIEPDENFFYNEERYRRFLQSTQTILSERIEVVDYVPHNNIQRRAFSSGSKSASLFLD